MNRNEEYKALLMELEDTPLKLDFTYERAQLRRKEQMRRMRKRRAIVSPFGFIAAVFAIFVLLVNISPAFACTVGKVPLLHDLVKYVAFSPSLSAAVDNNYYQEIDKVQTINGITADIEYIIVDQKQLSVFYTLNSDAYPALDAMPEISDSSSDKPVSASVSWGGGQTVSGDLCKVTVDFVSGTMPEALKLKLKVSESVIPASPTGPPPSIADYRPEEEPQKEPVYIAEFNFDLDFNPSYLDKAEKYSTDSSFVIDGQTLTLISADIYPTSMRLTFDGTESNTEWLKSIDFYVENEKGERFDSIKNGVSAYGSPDSPMTPIYIAESPFFSKSKNLTLHITGATWLDKSIDKVHIDLASKKADYLPADSVFEMSEKTENGWSLAFSEPSNCGVVHSQLWGGTYYDSQGKEFSINIMSTSEDSYLNYGKKAMVSMPGKIIEQFELKNYPYDEAWLRLEYSKWTLLDKPMSIKIK